MAIDDELSQLVSRLLARIIARHHVEQAFLFNSIGEPFWVARTPITRDEFRLLDDATDLIEELESKRTKPFIAHDAARRFSIAALAADSDLYVVTLNTGPDQATIEARVIALRADLLPEVNHLRNPDLRLHPRTS